MCSAFGQNATDPDIIWTHLVWPSSMQAIRVDDTIGKRELPIVVSLKQYDLLKKKLSQTRIVFPLAITAKYIRPGRQTRQIYEQYAELGFLIAQQLAHYLDTIRLPTVLSQENEQFKAFVEVRLRDPQFARSSNVYDLKLSKEVCLNDKPHMRP